METSPSHQLIEMLNYRFLFEPDRWYPLHFAGDRLGVFG
jgi:hypothetical protein